MLSSFKSFSKLPYLCTFPLKLFETKSLASYNFSSSQQSQNSNSNDLDPSFEDLAKGCIIGAFCGDAIGTVLEFQTNVSKKEVKHALSLPGGGPFKTGKGQITDDSELALCLGHGLVEGKGVLDLNKIAAMYGKWVESNPFDMGITTRNALGQLAWAQENHAKRARICALKSINSQSNGALMRITPLCVWSSELDRDSLKKAVLNEAKLTHANATAIFVNIAYAYTIQHLLKHKGDNIGAYEKCKEIVTHLEDREIMYWINDMEQGKLPYADVKIGWVKIAFCNALHHLRKNSSYLEAIEEMLIQGGDTDTNCCIVGGMMGALHGYSKLPEDIVKRVLEFDPEKEQGIERPDFLVPGKCVEKMIQDLIRIRPNSLKVEGEEGKEEIWESFQHL